MSVLEEIMIAIVTAVSVIPVPEAIANFQWPDTGFLGHALIGLGIPQAMTILASAFLFRFLRSLIPLIKL